MGISVRWQTRAAALKSIHSFGDHAPEQLGFALPEVIPQVSACIVDLKKEVCEAAEVAMVCFSFRLFLWLVFSYNPNLILMNDLFKN
jgi:hypothetical protein